jgi:tetratricopeptide (TPR) repeat protein
VDDRGRALAASAAEWLTQAGRRALALGDMPAVAKLLQRAVELLPADAPGRPELLVDLGSALLETGTIELADTVLAEAAGAVDLTADPRRAWRVRLDCLLLRFVHGREQRGNDEVGREAERAIAALTELGDDAGLARAWLLLGEVHNVLGRMAAMAEAAERAMDHARKAGDLPRVDLAISRLGIALPFGPMPVEEAIGRMRELLDQTRGRRWEAWTLRAMARLEARRGRFAEARALLAKGMAIVEELGLRFSLSLFLLTGGEIEAFADEPAAAERQLRDSYELCKRLGDKRYIEVATNLAEVLHLQGRDEEALWFTEEVEALAEPDIPEQFLWRKARAKVLAARGEVEEAERLAREAVALAERTDHLEEHADALMTLAEMLRRAGRADEATPALRDALGLSRQKGNTVLARRAQQALETSP